MAQKDSRASGGGIWNGFETIPEGPAMFCDEQRIHPHTLPPEALIFVPSAEDSMSLFKNGDKERKIHNNIELDDFEKKCLELLQAEARAQGCKFLPSITSMATRFLSRARGDPTKAIQLMTATQTWRLDYFSRGPVTDQQVLEDLRHGIVYFTGRDSSLRPTIVVRPKRIPQEWYRLKCIDRFIRCLIFCMEYMLWYMMIPGRIENTNVIVDLKDLGITQLPIGPLNEVYKVMSHHYIGRVFRFYVVNLSWVLSTISGAVKALLTDRQKQKLMIMGDVKELRESFALHQLEKDMGGTREVIKDFFPFAMPPGPFTAGNDQGPSTNVVEGAHTLLADSKAARQGTLWDASKSKLENTNLMYSDDAYRLFERCNYPIPPNCPMPAEKQLTPVNDAEEEPQRERAPRVSQREMRQSLRDLGIVSVDFSLAEGAEPIFTDEGPQDNKTEEATSSKVQPLEPTPALALPKAPHNGIKDDEAETVSADQKIHEDEGQVIKPESWWACGSCRVSGSVDA